ACLSVLTNEEFFQGSLSNLERASRAVSIPCLRKDFIVDESQILEARAYCADAVLLIVAALDDSDLRRLKQAAAALSLDVLCEVHDETELERAIGIGFTTIGVNSRDLRTCRSIRRLRCGSRARSRITVCVSPRAAFVPATNCAA